MAGASTFSNNGTTVIEARQEARTGLYFLSGRTGATEDGFPI